MINRALLLCVILPCHLLHCEILEISQYLDEVFEKNEELKSSKNLQESSLVIAKESNLLYYPRLNSSANEALTQNPQFIPGFPLYLKNITLLGQDYKVGINQDTPVGLRWEVKSEYIFSKINYDKTLPSFFETIISSLNLPKAQNWNVTQGISVTQNFWKNGFGRGTRAIVAKNRYQSLSRSYQEGFHLDQAKVQIERTYWQLVIARELKKIRLESLQQAKNLFAYIETKKEKELVLESDVYQAQTILNASRLNYQKAAESEKFAAISFNALRYIASSNVPEKLLPLSSDILQTRIPKEKGSTKDILAQHATMKYYEAENQLEIEDLRPNLDLSASFGLTGSQTEFEKSVNMSWHTPYKSATLMVKFDFPLAPFKVSKTIRALRQRNRAIRLHYEDAKFQQEQNFAELHSRLQENFQTLKLIIEDQVFQKKKYENAKDEYDKGLSTFFVVTNAFQDYLSNKILLLQNFEMILDLLINLQLYNTSVD